MTNEMFLQKVVPVKHMLDYLWMMKDEEHGGSLNEIYSPKFRMGLIYTIDRNSPF